jgi:hypothetical protein
MRQNNIHGAEAGKAFANMLAQNSVLKDLDLSSQKVGKYGDDLDAAFAKEFAVGICDNGALTSLNLSSNELWDEGAKIVAEAIKVTNCAIAIILAPFLCLSDLSFNCCCLPISTGPPPVGQWSAVEAYLWR